MATNHTPTTPLPWSDDDTILPESNEDAIYAAHAANAYPKLVGAIQDYMAAQERRDGLTRDDEARGRATLRDLLRDLGEDA